MGALAHQAVLAQDGIFHPGAFFHHRTGHKHGVGDYGALLHHGVVAEDGVLHLAPDVAALSHGAIAHIGRLGKEGRRAGGRAAVNGPALIQQVQPRARREHIHIGIPQGIQSAHVLPVSLKAVGHHLLSGLQHGGDDILAEIIGRVGVSIVL